MYFKFLTGNVIFDRNNTVWRTATGRMTPIHFMTTNHINNCISCLKGEGHTEIPNPYHGKTKEEWIYIFETELSIRREENIRIR